MIPSRGSWTESGSPSGDLTSESLACVGGIQTWQDFLLLAPLLVACGAEEARRSAGEAVVRQLGVLLADEQGLEQGLGCLLIVLHCDLEQRQKEHGKVIPKSAQSLPTFPCVTAFGIPGMVIY